MLKDQLEPKRGLYALGGKFITVKRYMYITVLK